jgi:predicted lipoprotein with Yx(FWY)xxD motif
MHGQTRAPNEAGQVGGRSVRRRWWVGVAGGIAAAAILLPACSSSSSTTTTTTAASTASTSGATSTTAPTSPTSGVVDATSVGTHGVILVTRTGATLYRYTPDGTGPSTCTGTCATAWPPLTVPAGTTSVAAGSGVTAADLGTVTGSNGQIQVTYNKMPLYTYAGDSAPGQANGQGVGGTWFVLPASGGTGGSGTSVTTTTSAAHGY